MLVKVSLNENEIKIAIARYIADSTRVTILPNDIRIEVKSAQNYKAEWETAKIRCEFEAQAKGS